LKLKFIKAKALSQLEAKFVKGWKHYLSLKLKLIRLKTLSQLEAEVDEAKDIISTWR